MQGVLGYAMLVLLGFAVIKVSMIQSSFSLNVALRLKPDE